MAIEMFFSISAILISIGAIVLTYLSYRNTVKYQNPIIEVTFDLRKDTMYPAMNSYHFVVVVKNLGKIPAMIDHPLTIQILDLKGKDVVIPKIISGYDLPGDKLPRLIKRGDDPLKFKIDSIKISDLIGSMIGEFKIDFIIIDNQGSKYTAKKPMKIKFVSEEGKSVIRPV